LHGSDEPRRNRQETNMFTLQFQKGRSVAVVAAFAFVSLTAGAQAGECPAGKSKPNFRRMVIEPGGIVPWHSHDDRPALIYVAEGEILEFASNCAAPIHHKAGEIRAEKHGTAHWWKNLSDKPTVLFIADVRADPNDKHM
jgi:quercetin dioxygenase-like cupin family protein